MPSTDPVLAAEAAHLHRSRAALVAMHERAGALFDGTVTAGDAVSTAYLRQALFRRMVRLQTDPATPPFFGRLDYRREAGAGRDESLHLGRQHVTAEAGDEPLVIDWRADMARPFYRASPTEPMGVGLRRRFGFADGELTAYEDEDLTAPADAAADSDILQAEVERPRSGPMRDIVATIQPEQDLLVRADLQTSLCIQGAPGTGKTAVGLHRAAYLLYAFAEQLRRAGVMVIGPNDSFLSYIGDVLPALGEIEVEQYTIDSLLERCLGVEVRGVDPVEVAMIKSDARMAQVIARAVWNNLAEPTENLVVPRGSRQWRVPTYLIAETLQNLRDRGVRYGAAREMLPMRLAHQVLLRMEAAGDSPDDRVQAAVARSKPVKDCAKKLWPQVDPRKLIFALLTDELVLRTAAEGILDEAEIAALLIDRPPRSVRSMRWSSADLALLDAAADELYRTPSYGHLIIDEAQDLSPMQLRALGRRASSGSVTLLGDLAQATTAWSTGSWPVALAHLQQPETRVSELTAGFRVPASVIEYAARLLPSIAPELAPPHSVRRGDGDFAVIASAERDTLLRGIRERIDRPGTLGLICADRRLPEMAGLLTEAAVDFRTLGAVEPGEGAVDLVPASLAKGLEFDQVIVVEPAEIVEAEADELTGLRRLYVVLTRAVSGLLVLHERPLPAALG
ncbi:HelD family protein [Naumannella halotolerans]|uniref:DNA helicase IV n=1 Tax=Naumannella halotolerans TaxID=993414 RepID=A0A4R7J526_9ACTN|nr:AAA family ATPase [Naumannella halotolerans]TDT32441.1 DNA helicase IV [Naumannella halotolerans]